MQPRGSSNIWICFCSFKLTILVKTDLTLIAPDLQPTAAKSSFGEIATHLSLASSLYGSGIFFEFAWSSTNPSIFLSLSLTLQILRYPSSDTVMNLPAFSCVLKTASPHISNRSNEFMEKTPLLIASLSNLELEVIFTSVVDSSNSSEMAVPNTILLPSARVSKDLMSALNSSGRMVENSIFSTLLYEVVM